MDSIEKSDKRLWKRLLWLAFVVCAGYALFLAFDSGCAGNVKTGAEGDPLRGLEFESYAFGLSLLAAVIAAYALSATLKLKYRYAYGVGFGLAVMTILWIAAIQLEWYANQACF